MQYLKGCVDYFSLKNTELKCPLFVVRKNVLSELSSIELAEKTVILSLHLMC